jgi:hypothetical protein
VEGKVYRFRVEDVEITKVAEKAGITEVAEKAGITEVAKKARITEVAEMAKMTEGVQGIHTTARHVVQPVAKMAEAFIKTARHVM